jgi:hypothetical protein
LFCILVPIFCPGKAPRRKRESKGKDSN